MRIIRQTKHNTCVACVLAMAVGESEQYVLDWFEHNDPPFNDEDALIFLAHHGIFMGVCLCLEENDRGKNIGDLTHLNFEISLDSNFAYMVVESQSVEGQTHAVLWDRKHILDPQEDTPQLLSNYKVLYVYPMLHTLMRSKQPVARAGYRRWQRT